jgi:hypothetical protein
MIYLYKESDKAEKVKVEEQKKVQQEKETQSKILAEKIELEKKEKEKQEKEKNQQQNNVIDDSAVMRELERRKNIYDSYSRTKIENVKRDYCSGNGWSVLDAFYTTLRKMLVPLPSNKKIYADPTTNDVSATFYGDCTYSIVSNFEYEDKGVMYKQKFGAIIRYSGNIDGSMPRDDEWIIVKQEFIK